LEATQAQSDALGIVAEKFGVAQRRLFAAMASGGDPMKIKKAFMASQGVDSRQYNALRMELGGKVDAVEALRKIYAKDQERAIDSLKKLVGKLSVDPNKVAAAAKAKGSKKASSTWTAPIKFETKEARAKRLGKLHQKKRRLHRLEAKFSKLQADMAADRVRLCFGSKKLFNAQFDLHGNGYDDHADWLQDWRAARSSQFFVVGSKDEFAGCQACQASEAADGSLDLKVKLPAALVASHGTHLEFSGLKFAYGHEQIVQALKSSKRVDVQDKSGKLVNRRTGTALSYRFLKDQKGWRVFVSVAVEAPEIKSDWQLGAIGLDVNADHLALAETDRFGNLVRARRIGLPTYGKSTGQSQAMIWDAAKAIAEWAKEQGKPLVIEKLDFAKKKSELAGTDPKYARMLSSFACNKVASAVKAACFRAGVEVWEVNPAYTSVIGAVNHARVRGISVHMGAALAVARRGLGFCEKPAVREGVVPARNGGHVAFELPARNVSKHVWSHWAAIRKELKAAHEEHYRCGDGKKPPPPLSRENGMVCATDITGAGFPGARGPNRGVLDHVEDVPF
jgi:IS605 OrfB family transposase